MSPKTLTWRDALRAMSIDARRRAANSHPMPSGPSDPVTVAEKTGARYAFNVMADELEYLAKHYSAHEALEKLRKLLEIEQGEFVVVGLTDEGEELQRVRVAAAKLEKAKETLRGFSDWIDVFKVGPNETLTKVSE